MTILLWINLILSIIVFTTYALLVIANLRTSNKIQIKEDWSIYLVFLLPIIITMVSIFISTYFLFFEF